MANRPNKSIDWLSVGERTPWGRLAYFADSPHPGKWALVTNCYSGMLVFSLHRTLKQAEETEAHLRCSGRHACHYILNLAKGDEPWTSETLVRCEVLHE